MDSIIWLRSMVLLLQKWLAIVPGLEWKKQHLSREITLLLSFTCLLQLRFSSKDEPETVTKEIC